VLDALDHGIALDFALTLQAQTPAWLGRHHTLLHSERHLQLRYFPLSRQYQLRDLDLGDTRSYPSRTMLIAAFEDLRLQLPPEWNATAGNSIGAQRYELHIELQRDNLPGAMRLPALLLSDWRLSTGDYTWPVADAG
jgi:hypothetical protein